MSAYSLSAQEDPQQRLRIQRNLIAAGTSLLVIFLLFSYYLQGFLPRSAFIHASAAILALIALFFLVFRFGVNTKFSDRSLTMHQMIPAVLVLSYVIYHVEDGRGALLLAYILVFEFGVFRLNTRQLLTITALVLGLHVVMILMRTGSETPKTGVYLVEWLVLAVVLIWFSVIGGYLSNLRQSLRDFSVKDELTGI